MGARMPYGVTWSTLPTEQAAEAMLQERLRKVGGYRFLLPDRLWTFRYEGRALIPVEVKVR